MRTHKRAIAKAKLVLKDFKIRGRFSLRSSRCEAYASEGYVFIGLNSSEFVNEAAVMSAVFHEIAHVVNYRNKKYFRYHNDKVLDRKSFEYAVKFGLKAEQHTDFVAAKLMATYFPNMKFSSTYDKPEMKQRYREEFIPLLRSYVKE